MIQTRRATSGEPRWAYTPNDPAVPRPAIVARFVRSDGQWATIIRAALGPVVNTPRGDAAAIAARLSLGRALLQHGPASDGVGRMLLTIYPPVRCALPGCAAWYLPYSRRVRYCSERCQRTAAVASAARKRSSEGGRG